MSIKAYFSAVADRMKQRVDGDAPSPMAPGQLSEHFHETEFACRCCGRVHPEGVPSELVDHLEALRAHFGKPVRINSGYRCPRHNARVGGAKNSLHMAGKAADHYIEGVSAREVADFHEKRGVDGLGRYPSFTHIDIRGYKARWGSN